MNRKYEIRACVAIYKPEYGKIGWETLNELNEEEG